MSDRLPGTAHPYRVLGFEISRELNLIALLAFALSIVSLGIQLAQALRGPELEVLPNSRVTFALYGDRGPATPAEDLDLLVNTGLTFINSGGSEQDDVIDSAYLDLTLGSAEQPRRLQYLWLHFEQLVAADDGSWRATESVSAHQLLVPGQNVVARQVSFAGFGHPPLGVGDARTGPLPWDAFRAVVEDHPAIRVHITALPLRSAKPISAECEVEMDDVDLARLAEGRWVTLFCDGGP